MACNTDITNAQDTITNVCPDLSGSVTLYCPDGPVTHATTKVCVRDYLQNAGWTTDDPNDNGDNNGDGDGDGDPDDGDGDPDNGDSDPDNGDENGNGDNNGDGNGETDPDTGNGGASTQTLAAGGLALWWLTRD